LSLLAITLPCQVAVRLSYVRTLLDPNYTAGADGNFGAPELVDWRLHSEDALNRVTKGLRDLEVIRDAALPVIRRKRQGEDVFIGIIHPFWRERGQSISTLMDGVRTQFGSRVKWVDSFELARRPFLAIARLLS
jgi:DEAD/DEAH box helicase domain-containing protein